ncbi:MULTISPECIES: hypothetical protein [unclassified Acinetobacter]|uniref:hypothetical protein n=1 Tax=unclassified Acinetobacter TaxID=196816 RepID=UPI0015D3C1B9|nr:MULTISPECIES: hypothetical protein [unclassified Acinetobacter]
MSGILLLIPMIIIGYFFKKKHFYLNYKFSKLNGHHLYFASAAFGFFFVFISTILYFLLANFYILIFCFFSDEYDVKINLFRSIRTIFSEQNFSFNVFFIYSLAMLIARIVAWYDKKSILKEVKDIHNPLIFNIISEDPTDGLLNLSAVSDDTVDSRSYENRTIMLTMKDRKVYIGVVSENRKEMFLRFSQGSDDFEFMPLLSGYRDKDNLDLVITTDYSEAIDKKLNITVVLKRNEILSLTKVNSEQLSKFLFTSNFLYKELISSHYQNKKIIIRTKDDKYILGAVSQFEVLNERILKRYPYFYFDIEKTSDEIDSARVIFSLENIKEVYVSDDIDILFNKLIRKKAPNIEAFNLKDIA